jgi:hypothetical protein
VNPIPNQYGRYLDLVFFNYPVMSNFLLEGFAMLFTRALRYMFQSLLSTIQLGGILGLTWFTVLIIRWLRHSNLWRTLRTWISVRFLSLFTEYDEVCLRFRDLKADFKCLHRLKYIEKEKNGIFRHQKELNQLSVRHISRQNCTWWLWPQKIVIGFSRVILTTWVSGVS